MTSRSRCVQIFISFHYLFPDFIWDGRIIKTEYDWTVVRDFKWNLNKNSQNWPISLKVLIKNVWMSDKSWEPAKLDTLGMLNNFCFHVYAQKWLSQSHTLSFSFSISHSHTLSLSHPLSLDMLNNFCFHVYAQKSVYWRKLQCFFWPHHHQREHPVSLPIIELVPS